MKPYVLDIETSDPDDFITLLFLLGHPEVDLRGVTLTPGSPEQAGLVLQALRWFGREDVEIGVFESGSSKKHVSEWHYKAFPSLLRIEYTDLEPGWQVLDRLLGEETTLVCGAPLKNLGALLTKRLERGDKRSLGRAFIQGGFAGQGVVPEECQLEKFRGKVTCPSFNLNGDIPSALSVIANRELFSDLRFVSKNVAHGVIYDSSMHEHLRGVLASRCPSSSFCDCPCHHDPGILHVEACCHPCEFCKKEHPPRGGQRLDWSQKLIWRGLSRYIDGKSEKKLHDPLAAACAIDPNIGIWEEVDMYFAGGGWGSYLSPGSGIQIITGYDATRFLNEFCKRNPL